MKSLLLNLNIYNFLLLKRRFRTSSFSRRFIVCILNRVFSRRLIELHPSLNRRQILIFITKTIILGRSITPLITYYQIGISLLLNRAPQKLQHFGISVLFGLLLLISHYNSLSSLSHSLLNHLLIWELSRAILFGTIHQFLFALFSLDLFDSPQLFFLLLLNPPS